MAKRTQKTPAQAARPIRNRRDYDGAAAVVKRISSQTDRDSAAEMRLQSLLRELDKFEDTEEDLTADFPEEYNYSGPRRRWSDEG